MTALFHNTRQFLIFTNCKVFGYFLLNGEFRIIDIQEMDKDSLSWPTAKHTYKGVFQNH